MLSYREKQLLASMKYNKSESDKLSDDLKRTLEQMKQGQILNVDESKEEYVPAQNMDDLYERAKATGFDSWTRASDILTPEKIADLQARKKSIEAEFNEKVKLRKADYAFLLPAILLQLGKQILFKLDLEPHLAGHDDTDKDFHDRWSGDIDGSAEAKLYFAPYQQVINSPSVPFDFIAGTATFKKTGLPTYLGLSGDNHRFKSVGHDPILGLLFGTSNIVTNTGTFYLDKEKLAKIKNPYPNLFMATVHVGYENPAFYTNPYVRSLASTLKMFKKVFERFKEEPDVIQLALMKEIQHIESDQQSVAGIPIPFVTGIFGSETVRKWAREGIDWDHFTKNFAVVRHQLEITVLINIIISSLHRLYLMWNDVKDAGTIADSVKYYIKHKPNTFDDIRTKKIIMYSNSIASTVNLAVCVGGGAISASTGNPQLSKEFFSHLDIGGLMVSLFTLFHDGKYILKVKDDFIKSTINTDFEKRLHDIERGAQIEL